MKRATYPRRRAVAYGLAVVAALALAATRATAQTTTDSVPTTTEESPPPALLYCLSDEGFPVCRARNRTAVHSALEKRCQPHAWAHFVRVSADVPLERRPFNLSYWRRTKEWSFELPSKCIPTEPAAIIRWVFPSYAEDQALRVAGCESTGIPYHLNPYAKNPYSSASGLFQLLDTWWGGRFNPFNALANTRTAYQLWSGSGGTFRYHWAASIGCWS